MLGFGDLYRDLLFYPFRGVVNLFIFILMLFGGILIIPAVIALGYMFRIIETSSNGDKDLPNFDNGKELLINGIKFIGVGLVAFLLLLVVGFVLLIILAYLGLNETITNLTVLILGFLFMWVYPLMIGNMVYENRFTAAFNLKIFQPLKKIGYIKYTAYIIPLLILIIIPEIIKPIIYGITAPSNIAGLMLVILLIPLLLLYQSYIVIVWSRFVGLILKSQ